MAKILNSTDLKKSFQLLTNKVDKQIKTLLESKLKSKNYILGSVKLNDLTIYDLTYYGDYCNDYLTILYNVYIDLNIEYKILLVEYLENL